MSVIFVSSDPLTNLMAAHLLLCQRFCCTIILSRDELHRSVLILTHHLIPAISNRLIILPLNILLVSLLVEDLIFPSYFFLLNMTAPIVYNNIFLYIYTPILPSSYHLLMISNVHRNLFLFYTSVCSSWKLLERNRFASNVIKLLSWVIIQYNCHTGNSCVNLASVYEIEPNPLITTSVYTTPRLYRQIFRGTN